MPDFVPTPDPTKQLRIRAYGNRVQLIHMGKLLAEMPWEAALGLADVIKGVARKAEETDKAEVIAADQAILTRFGFPVGLSNNPKIKREAFKESQYIPGPSNIIPTGVVGTPSLKKGS